MSAHNMTGLMWWGYLHQDGTIQVNRWFGDHRVWWDYLHQGVVPPFEALTRKQATATITRALREA